MPRLPRGTCPDCGRSVALRKGDIVREHRANPPDDRDLCPGSGKPSEPTQ